MASKKRRIENINEARHTQRFGGTKKEGHYITERKRDEFGALQEVNERVRLATLVDGLRAKFEAKLKEEAFKPTVAEYLKLLQIEKEIQEKELEEAHKEIVVTWIEPEGEFIEI